MKRNLFAMATILAAAILVWTWSAPAAMAQKAAANPGYEVKGKRLFGQYCASCHGRDGKGEGPVAMALKGMPPDLTMLQPPGEKFPFYDVQIKIDGEKAVAAHGT